MADSDDDDYDDEEDLKMQKLLAAWDNNDDDDDDGAFEDKDDDEDDDYRAPNTRSSKPSYDDDDDDNEGEVLYDEDEVTVDQSVSTYTPAGKKGDTLKKKPKEKKLKKPLGKVTDIEEDDLEEDVEMKKMLESWDADVGEVGEPSEDPQEEADLSDDDSEQSEREVILDDNVIDHVVLAAPDLDDAMQEFEDRAGVGCVIAGSIKGLGLKCARVSFNDSSYLEIIAPDPNAPGPIGELLKSKNIKELTPFHYAIRSSACESLKTEVKEFSYTPDHITMFGARADGSPKKWEMLYLYGHRLGGIVPFFINWEIRDHPCRTLPVVGKLKKFSIRAPEGDPVHELFEHVGVEGINIEIGKPKISFQFSSPEGTVKFQNHKPVGFKFPGFEDEDDDDDE